MSNYDKKQWIKFNFCSLRRGIDVTPDDFDNYDDLDLELNLPSDKTIYEGYFLNKVNSGALVPRFMNGKRSGWSRFKNTGLSNECCLKQCSYWEMIGYCDGRGGFKSLEDLHNQNQHPKWSTRLGICINLRHAI